MLTCGWEIRPLKYKHRNTLKHERTQTHILSLQVESILIMDVALKIVCSYSKKKHTLVILHWSEECRERESE